MANPADLKIVRGGPSKIAQWRQAKHSPKLDLSGADLSGVELDGADLSGANLRGTNLQGARLRQASLTQADLTEANLAKADLTKANFSSASLRGACFRLAEMREASLMNSSAEAADFHGANLVSASFFLTDLSRADLSNANLAFARLDRARLRQANLSAVRLHDALVRHVDLSGVRLAGTQLGNTVLVNIDLSAIAEPELLVHHSASVVGVDTLFRSRHGTSVRLLQQLGVPVGIIKNLALLTSRESEFMSCAIYCESADGAVGAALCEHLRQAGFRCWLIDAEQGLSLDFDQILVLLSAKSIRSWRFVGRLTALLQYELAPVLDSLVPVRIDDAVLTWAEPLGQKIMARGVIDCRPPFDAGFDRVLEALQRPATRKSSP